MELDLPVGVLQPLVPTHFHNRPPPYLIVAGLVFTSLSVPYLHACDAWEDYVSPSISYFLGKMKEPLQRETDEVVILAQVLAHRENLGYDKLSDLHLDTLNGKQVLSLLHLQNLIDECEDTFLRFEFASPDNHMIVLERSISERVTREICEEHSIQKPHFLHTAKHGDANSATSRTSDGVTNGEDVLEAFGSIRVDASEK